MKRKYQTLLLHDARVSREKRGALRAFAWLAAAASIVTGLVSGWGVALGLFLLANSIAFAIEPTNHRHALGLVPRTVNYVTGFQGIASGATATLNIPVNRRYHSLRIFFTNAAGAATDPTTIASNIKLIVNGVTMLDASPAQIIDLATMYRITPSTGECPIFFTEPWRNDTRTAEATSWDMFGQNTFVLQVTFLSPGGGVGVSAVLADFDMLRNQRLNRQTGKMEPFLAILKRTNLNVNTPAGDSDIVNIPTNWPIQRLLLDVSANAISTVQIFGDNNTKLFEATNSQNDDLLNANGLTATPFEFPIVFDYDSKLSSALRTAALDLKLNCTGANTTTIHLIQQVPGYV